MTRTVVQAAYRAKLPAMRCWLIEVAQNRRTVTYGLMMEVFGVDRFSLRHAMDYLGHEARNTREPVITAVIVSAKTGRCSDGLGKEFGVVDDHRERERLYAYWQRRQDGAPRPPVLTAGTLEERATRFASVAVRPDQVKFRRAVFLAHGGRCAVSGCDVDAALDAAHLIGRDWRRGRNRADDGLLLRKDLHALYDRGLLTITEGGVVALAPLLVQHYKEYSGVQIRTQSRSAHPAP